MVAEIEAEYRIAICDDIAADQVQIVSATGEIIAALKTFCEIGAYGSGKALLSALQNGKCYDILLLDVMMDQMDGMELARLLRQQGMPVVLRQVPTATAPAHTSTDKENI